jgi:HlyD family secretion protein
VKYFAKIFNILDSSQIKILILLQILVIFSSIMEVLGVASIAPFMAIVVDPQILEKNAMLKAVFDFFNFQSRETFLVATGYMVFTFILVGNLFILITNWCMYHFGNQLGRSISVSLYKSYLTKPYTFHVENNSSILGKNIFQEVTRVTNYIIIQMLILNSKVVTIALILVGLFYVNTQVTLISSVFLGGSYVLVYVFIKRKIYNNGRELSHLSAEGYQLVSEGLGGIKEVKLYGKENVYIKTFDKNMKDFAELNTENSVIPMVPRYVLEIVAFGGIVLSIVILLKSGHELVAFLPMLSLFAVAGIKIMPALQQAFYAVALMKSSFYSFDLIFDDIVQSKQVGDAAKDEHLSGEKIKLDHSVEIKNLVFSYPNSKAPILNHLNLVIPAGRSVALVGPSGSGKSTAIDILLSLLDPTNGDILIDGKKLDSSMRRSWQNAIGYVPQHVYLQDATFLENIAFGIPADKVNMDRLKNAAQLAKLDQFIESRPNGYQTRIGERGVQLSGGQRQRIGIARALYNEASILVFDEATSALDGITENEIMDSINELVGERTIIMVAHRLSTVKSCHTIYLIDSGKVTSSGTYEELKSNSLVFQNMINSGKNN